MLATFLLLWSSAHACSCAEVSTPDPLSCAVAERAFAATVTEVSLPRGLDHVWGPTPTRMHLSVDRVYRGAVPETVHADLSVHPGGCGWLHPPGTTLFVCDDRSGRARVLSSLCRGPARSEHGAEVEAGLQMMGHTAHPPELGGAPQPDVPRWLPLAAAGCGLASVVGVGLGRRRRPAPVRGLRIGRLLAAVVSVAAVLRVLGHLGPSMGMAHRDTLLWVGGSMALGALGLSMVLGWALGAGRIARSPGQVAAVVLLGPTVLLVGHVPLVLPVDAPDAVPCSVDRARALLASPDTLERAVAASPRACTWWGVAQFTVTTWSKLTPEGCLRFVDRQGQVWQVCPSEPAVVVDLGRRSLWD